MRRKSDTKHFANKISARSYLSFIQKPYEDQVVSAAVDRSFPHIDIPHQHHLSSNKSFNEVEIGSRTPPKTKNKMLDKLEHSPYLKKEGTHAQKLPKIQKKEKNSSVDKLENGSYAQRNGRNAHPMGNIRVLDYFQSGEQNLAKQRRSLEEEYDSKRSKQKVSFK